MFYSVALARRCVLLFIHSDRKMTLKPGLHISRKDRKHILANMLFKPFLIFVMITTIDVSQEILAMDVLTALK